MKLFVSEIAGLFTVLRTSYKGKYFLLNIVLFIFQQDIHRIIEPLNVLG